MSEYHDTLDFSIVLSGPRVTSKSSPSFTDEGAGPNAHLCFLKCLGLAQHLNIDFLPINWQRGLESVGTARIRQALVNADTDFAFKSFRVSQQCFSAEEESK